MKVALTPFDGCVGVVVPMPPVDALLYCVHYRQCMDFRIAPQGFVPFTVYCDFDIDGSDPANQQALVDYFCEHKDEVLAAARRIAITPTCPN